MSLPATNRKVLLAGDLMLDITRRGEVARIAPEAPAPIVGNPGVEYSLGGAAFTALQLRRCGCDVEIAGTVGNDINGDILLQLLADEGINTRFVERSAEITTVKERIIDSRTGTLIARIDSECMSPSFTVDTKREISHSLRDYTAVVISDYNKGVIDAYFLSTTTVEAHSCGPTIIADVKGSDPERYRGVDILKGTREEIDRLVGEHSSPEVFMSRYRIGAMVVTKGAEGVTLHSRDAKPLHFDAPVVAVNPIPTGAGDTFTAILAAGDGSLPERVTNACAITAHALSRGFKHTLDATDLVDPALRVLSAEQLQASRPAGRMVFTNGCFDILHAGHLHLLRRCAAMGDYLVVGLNSDNSVRRLKGATRPVNDVHSRAAMLSATGLVDLIIIFDTDTPLDLITTLRPDVLVKGGDYTVETVVGATEVLNRGGRVEIVDLLPELSTTNLLNHRNHNA